MSHDWANASSRTDRSQLLIAIPVAVGISTRLTLGNAALTARRPAVVDLFSKVRNKRSRGGRGTARGYARDHGDERRKREVQELTTQPSNIASYDRLGVRSRRLRLEPISIFV